MDCTASEGHFDIHGQLPQVTFRPRIHVDVCDLSLHQEPYRCPWSRLPPEDMLVLVVHAAAKDLLDMGGLCYHLRP